MPWPQVNPGLAAPETLTCSMPTCVPLSLSPYRGIFRQGKNEGAGPRQTISCEVVGTCLFRAPAAAKQGTQGLPSPSQLCSGLCAAQALPAPLSGNHPKAPSTAFLCPGAVTTPQPSGALHEMPAGSQCTLLLGSLLPFFWTYSPPVIIQRSATSVGE